MVVNMDASCRNYDILIIGGGIIGMACAWYASRKWPEKSIAVVDKGMVGKGITAYSACLVLPYGASPEKRALAERSRILFDELMETFPGLPYTSLPLVGVAGPARLQRVLESITVPGVQTQEAGTAIKGIPAYIELPADASSFYGIQAAYGDNDFAAVLAKELMKRNVTVWESTEITAVQKNSTGYDLLANYGMNLHAGAVIEATGAWMLRGLSRHHLQDKRVRTKKVIALHIDQVPSPEAPVLYFFDDDAFLMPQYPLSRWLFSYRCEDWDVDIEKDELTITETNMRDALRVLSRYNKDACSKVTGGRVFCDLYSPDGDPLIFAPQNNYIIAGAPGGSGFRLAPGIAEAAVEALARQ